MDATATTTGKRSGVRAILAGCALALLVSVGAADGAGAERPTGVDSASAGCRLLYDEWHRLRQEYIAIGYANGSGDPRLVDIMQKMRNVARTWDEAKCDDAWGSIATLEGDPNGSVLDDLTGDRGVVADPGSGDADAGGGTGNPAPVAPHAGADDDDDRGKKAKKGKQGKKGKKGGRGRR